MKRRRHLDESQRAMVSGKIANLELGANQHIGGSANLPTLFAPEPQATPISQATAAEMLNVSTRSVTAAKKVLKTGIPELVEAVERGEIAVSAAADLGQRLIAVRETCQHGEWLPWLEKEFGWSEWTARRFIAVAESFGSKSSTVPDLPIDAGALYMLSGPKVPEVVREVAVERAEGPCARDSWPYCRHGVAFDRLKYLVQQ